MKPNPKNRYNGRYNNNRGSRSFIQNITRHTALESSGPSGKLHGTALQLFEKYTQAAKDALIQNDRVLSETCLQYADHYARLQNIAIENEANNRLARHPQPTEVAEISVQSENAAETTSDSLPDFEVPKNQETDELSAEDKTVQAMDLSIPIRVMQENNQPQRRMPRRPRAHKAEQTPVAAELSSDNAVDTPTA